MKLGASRIEARLAQIGQEFGHGFGLELDRIAAALAAMGRPQDRLAPVLHVAGTNGKGSVCAYLRAIGEASGLRVHVFTSPHVIAPNERIRVAGQLIEDDAFIAALDRVALSGVRLTYFEAITAAALDAFSQTPADWVIMEVGLGGRFDATNVLDTALSIITPLGLDHQALLGPSIAHIAYAKAGILRAGGRAVIARQPAPAMAVIQAEAADRGTDLLRCGSEWDAFAHHGRLIVQTGDQALDLPAPALHGAHQFDNAGLAVMAALTMGDARVTPDSIGLGLRHVEWPGRLQPLTRGPLARLAPQAELWLDGGHNPHAAAALAAAMQAMNASRPAPLALIWAMLEGKDAAAFLAPFVPLAPIVLAIPLETGRAAHAPEYLAGLARSRGLAARLPDSLAHAITLASQSGASQSVAGRILICGSLHLIGAATASDALA